MYRTTCRCETAIAISLNIDVRPSWIDASPGILIPRFAGHTAKVQNEVAGQTDWDALLDKVASGPPVYSPLKLLDPVANIGEMFIHHEDVRRAQSSWTPRVSSPAIPRWRTSSSMKSG